MSGRRSDRTTVPTFRPIRLMAILSLAVVSQEFLMSMMRVHHKLSVDDYEQMISFGILNEADHVELIRGEIVEKMPKGSRHSRCVNRLVRHLNSVVGDRWLVSSQNPVRLDDSEPEPDVMLLRPRADEYKEANPAAADVEVVIEVSDTTLSYDRTEKFSLYAEAGIGSYWIVNLIDNCIEVHRQPTSDSAYESCAVFRTGEWIELSVETGIKVEVDQIL
jgi:Uma2 family endonuclease